MYTWYFFSTRVGKDVKKVVKPCVTALQMGQFVIILLHSLFHLASPEKHWSLQLAVVQMLLMLQMLWMFGDFFLKSYVRGGGASMSSTKNE
jgi:hypothetical protein